MPQPLLLEGQVEPEEVGKLRRTIKHLESDLADAQVALQNERRQSAKSKRALGVLRGQLEPLYQALQGIFGELTDVEVSIDTKGRSSRVDAAWETWTRKLPGKQSEFIKAMLEHGEMSVEQLRVTTHSAKQTVYETIHKLNRLGLINKNGGKFSLKEL